MRFSSDGIETRKGFLAIWSQFHTPTGCNNCDFPFTYLGTTFQTCISIQDVDTKPWCSYEFIPPVIITAPVKISCSDSDSSCPSSPSQTLITSPDYPLNYPNNANQVRLIREIHQLIFIICIFKDIDTYC